MNGFTETAMRLLIILETCYGQGFNFDTLRLLDFFAVFSRDLDGPQSLHPETPTRGGAYNLRKGPIATALEFLLAAELVAKQQGNYLATNVDDGDPYRSRYLTGIQAASTWMKEQYGKVGVRAFTARMKRVVISLAEESLSARSPLDPNDIFITLKTSYESDIERLKGLHDACQIFQCLLDVDHKAACNDNGPAIPPLTYFDDVHAKATNEISVTQSKYNALLQGRADQVKADNLIKQ